MLKKVVTSAVMTLFLAAAVPFMATNVEAQSRYCSPRTRHRAVARRTVYRRTVYRRSPYTYANRYTTSRYAYARSVYKRPNVYQRHRRLFNTAAGAGVGALIGGLLGGKRGLALGLLAGGLGSQVFTHYQKPKNHVRYRRY